MLVQSIPGKPGAVGGTETAGGEAELVADAKELVGEGESAVDAVVDTTVDIVE